MEEDLNTKLFIRSKKGITLTNEGNILFQKIENAMQAIEQGEKMIDQINRLESGSLVIAAGDKIITHFLLPYLEEFHIRN